MINEIANKYGFKLLLQFGSTVKSRTHAKSDIDIAYLSDKKLTLDEELQLILELENIFKDYDKVDLVNLKNTGALLGMEIVNNNKVLYETDYAYAQFVLKAVHQYHDFQPYFKLQADTNKKKLAKLLNAK